MTLEGSACLYRLSLPIHGIYLFIDFGIHGGGGGQEQVPVDTKVLPVFKMMIPIQCLMD